VHANTCLYIFQKYAYVGMYPSVYTKYVLNVCTKSVYFILKGKINQINRHALKYVYKVDKFYV